MCGRMEEFWIHPYIFGGKEPKERSNFGLKIEFLSFFPKIWSVMEKS